MAQRLDRLLDQWGAVPFAALAASIGGEINTVP